VGIFMDITNKFFNQLSINGIEFIPRYTNLEIWDAEFAQLDYQPVEYSTEMINYQKAYLSQKGSKTADLSFIILSGGKVCGLWLLTAVETNDHLKLTSLGQPISAPLFLHSTTRKQIKRFCLNAMECLTNISEIGFHGPLVMHQGPTGINRKTVLTNWYRQGMKHGAIVQVKYEMYVDLSLTLDEIRSHYRKSYKPFINKGLKEWGHNILTSSNIDRKNWNKFRYLHEVVSGRVTRDISTWDLQYEMISSGVAFLVMLYDLDSNELVGGGFFVNTRDEGVYSVAAYDRNLFKKPLGHVVQHLAINHMRSLGLKWYKIGEKQHIHDTFEVSKKEGDISKFKEGFCTDMIYKFELIFPKTEEKISDCTLS
jgi:FemAB family protein